MAKIIDMENKKFNHLTVIRKSHQDKRGEWFWICKCDCGNETIASGYKIRSGHTKSCGCVQEEHRKEGFHKRHGMTDTKLYIIWENMRRRCYYSKNNMYKNYGGRGIRVCDEWKDDFEPFMKWAQENGYKEGLSIERIDVNGNYEPSNCKWITPKEQYLNRTDSHLITAFGKTQTIKEWADESGLNYDTIERRINQYGWTAEEAVTVKPHKRAR